MEEKRVFEKAIYIAKDNPAIERIDEKCIDCGICTNTCRQRENIENTSNKSICINCGQCVQTCPTGAIVPKQDKNKLKEAIKNKKVCIAYTSPSVRVALGDEFGME